MTNTRLTLVMLVLAAGVGFAVVSGRSPAAPPPGVRAWEYKVVQEFQINNLGRQVAAPGGAERDIFVDGFNALGAEGWELVTMATRTAGPSLYYFKRPK